MAFLAIRRRLGSAMAFLAIRVACLLCSVTPCALFAQILVSVGFGGYINDIKNMNVKIYYRTI